MNKQKLENLIKDFSLEKLEEFLFDANFVGVQNLEPLLGEIKTDDNKKIIVVAKKVENHLSISLIKS